MTTQIQLTTADVKENQMNKNQMNKNPAPNKNPVEQFAEESFPTGSITALANAADVTYQTVHKTVLGLYSSIPKKLADYMAQNSDYSQKEWNTLYSLWIGRELEILRNDIKAGHMEAEAFFVPASQLGKKYSTFADWRQSLSYSQVDFCKTFLMHQAILNKYELGHMKNIPVSLVERLRFLGLSQEYINAVDDLPITRK